MLIPAYHMMYLSILGAYHLYVDTHQPCMKTSNMVGFRYVVLRRELNINVYIY